MICDREAGTTRSLGSTFLWVASAVCPRATHLALLELLTRLARAKELDWGSWRPWRPPAGKGEAGGGVRAVFTDLSAVRAALDIDLTTLRPHTDSRGARDEVLAA